MISLTRVVIVSNAVQTPPAPKVGTRTLTWSPSWTVPGTVGAAATDGAGVGRRAVRRRTTFRWDS
ncbi:MAG: hypothetical protein R2909_17650 [Gemmatimonadales bacterium]